MNALETLAWLGIVSDDVASADNVVDRWHIIQDGFEGWQVRVNVRNQTDLHTPSLRGLTEMRVVSLLTVLGVDPCGSSNYCFVWVDSVSTMLDLLERCF